MAYQSIYEQNKNIKNKFTTLNYRNLSNPKHQNLLDRLNKSCNKFRLDYLFLTIFLGTFSIFLFNGNQSIMAILSALSLGVGVVTSLYEGKRRTVTILYDTESIHDSSYNGLVESINVLSECDSLWSYTNKNKVISKYESKINSGATILIEREPAGVGSGQPPWIETNISVPVIQSHDISIYFMPEYILIYDRDGVGCIEHDELSLTVSASEFVEKEFVPSDAEIIYYTSMYVNKDGTPDGRFKENREVPICLYGDIYIMCDTFLLLHLQTSNNTAPLKFFNSYYKEALKMKYWSSRVKKLDTENIKKH